MLYMPIIDEIIKRRTLLGLSQNRTSILSNLGGVALGRLERGVTTQIHHSRAEAIAKTLECNVCDIFKPKNQQP